MKVAMSSFSTGSVRVADRPAAACPTVAPSGTGRSVVKVWKTAPLTLAIGPQRYSPRSIMWLPMSASAPVPGPALVAPADRVVRVLGVVAPVVPVEVPHRRRSRRSRSCSRMALMPGVRRNENPTPDWVSAASAAATIALASSTRRGQRLLAQHVLARGQQGLDDRPVQLVGDRDRHDVDVAGRRRSPARTSPRARSRSAGPRRPRTARSASAMATRRTSGRSRS